MSYNCLEKNETRSNDRNLTDLSHNVSQEKFKYAEKNQHFCFNRRFSKIRFIANQRYLY